MNGATLTSVLGDLTVTYHDGEKTISGQQKLRIACHGLNSSDMLLHGRTMRISSQVTHRRASGAAHMRYSKCTCVVRSLPCGSC